MRRLRSIAGWQSQSRISLSIKTPPADGDPYALRIARQLAAWYDAAGIDASVTPLAEEELYRQVLLDNDFDVFVGRLTPGISRPDELYALLHSKYANDPGWQNPFGYANLGVDEHLGTQRRSTAMDRQSTVGELQRSIARTQPFSTVAIPDDVRAVRTTRFENWHANTLSAPTGYLSLERAPTASSFEAETLRIVVTDDRVTENLNPLAVEYRRSGFLLDLIYDALGYETAVGEVQPWLAASWDVTSNAPTPTATVTLRDDLVWHDDEPLTASDVAFTFSLLDDTTLGGRDGQGASADATTHDDATSAGASNDVTASTGTSDGTASTGTTSDDETPTPTTKMGDQTTIPAPRFRSRASLVSDVTVVDERTAEIHFVECSPQVAVHALTIPLLPEHVWVERTGKASISGISFGAATEALVTDNVPPVGSGAFEFANHTPRESLDLERFDDHFLAREDPPNVDARTQDGPAFERIHVQAVGSDSTAVDLVADDEADVTGTSVGASTVPRIGRANDLDLLVDSSNEPYVVGYNAQRPPLTNPRFRINLAHLVDQTYVVDQTFAGYAKPVASPLAGTTWLPPELAYEKRNPVTPFFGDDGELNVSRARSAFRQAGFEYVDGNLVQND